MRLVKWLAGAGAASRRGAGELVLAGRVKVNGRPVKEPWLDVDPSSDRVHLDGKPVRPPRPGVTLALDFPNKAMRTLDLMNRLDEHVLAGHGAVYPAKDARMSAASFRAYFPNWEELIPFIDPRFSSSFWRRVS